LADALRRRPFNVNLLMMDYLGTLQQITKKGAHGVLAYSAKSVLDNNYEPDFNLEVRIVAVKRCVVELDAVNNVTMD
jgi:20S proteasome alpha/beta subunit